MGCNFISSFSKKYIFKNSKLKKMTAIRPRENFAENIFEVLRTFPQHISRKNGTKNSNIIKTVDSFIHLFTF